MSVTAQYCSKTHGQSCGCVTLFDLSHSSFGIGLWESGVRFIKHGLQRDGKVLFNSRSHL